MHLNVYTCTKSGDGRLMIKKIFFFQRIHKGKQSPISYLDYWENVLESVDIVSHSIDKEVATMKSCIHLPLSLSQLRQPMHLSVFTILDWFTRIYTANIADGRRQTLTQQWKRVACPNRYKECLYEPPHTFGIVRDIISTQNHQKNEYVAGVVQWFVVSWYDILWVHVFAPQRSDLERVFSWPLPYSIVASLYVVFLWAPCW